jgi:hypothetical protein
VRYLQIRVKIITHLCNNPTAKRQNHSKISQVATHCTFATIQLLSGKTTANVLYRVGQVAIHCTFATIQLLSGKTTANFLRWRFIAPLQQSNC